MLHDLIDRALEGIVFIAWCAITTWAVITFGSIIFSLV